MAVSAARRKNLLDGLNSRPGEDGNNVNESVPADQPGKKTSEGLLLSEIQMKPLDWFKYNPENSIFRECKNEDYFRGLKKDIEETGAIIDPLIAMPDGLLVEGESRHSIASELFNSGKANFAKIPVRIILSGITPDKITERLYLGNLSRFDVPHTVKLFIYSKIWPDYFLSLTDGKKTVTRKEIAAATGLSESQIKRNKNVIQKASELAKSEEAPLSVKHIEKARAEKGAHDAPPQGKKTKEPDAESAATDAYGLPANVKFLKSAVILLAGKKETAAARLLIDHFLKKNEKNGFYKLLPEKIRDAVK
jgi:hypothetical protein